MTTTSDPRFLVLHALRIKGVASDELAAAISGLSPTDVSSHLAALLDEELIVRRDGRMAGSMLTPTGKQVHPLLLKDDVSDPARQTALDAAYEAFLPINGEFKQACTDWQVRADSGQPNDHSDSSYDEGVVVQLGDVHDRTTTLLGDLAETLNRFGAYASRLDSALARVKGGELAAFARPLADSYHDVWMELHTDLLVSLGKERGEQDEG